MKPSIARKLDQLARRLEELNGLLSAEGVTRDLAEFRRLSREHAEITPIAAKYAAYRAAESDLAAANDMAGDPEMKSFAEAEAKSARERMAALEEELQRLLLPRDPNDERNIFVEIRAGTGGDEAALFAGDLFGMYSRYAERNGWKVEVLSSSPTELGGFKEVIARIDGEGAYSKLKFESGGHRVQRVPATETQGRIHTSAATVAVMPEADEVADVELNPAEIKVDTYPRLGAPAGSTSTRPSRRCASRICRPGSSSSARTTARSTRTARRRSRSCARASRTCASASSRRRRRRRANRSSAPATAASASAPTTSRRTASPTTASSSTLYRIAAIMDGDLDEIVDALAAEHQAEQLAALGESAAA